MPYNNTPIAPSKEVTGHVSLPLARVQKIINADPERLIVTKNASFAIALATEMMIQYLATSTHNVVKTERKPRRNIQYRDVSSAVSRTDNLEFLVDVVPKTMQYGAWRKRKAAELEATAKESAIKEGGEEAKGKGETGETGETGEKDTARPANANNTTQTTLPSIPIGSDAAQDLLARAREAESTSSSTPQNGTELDPLARKEIVPPVPETEAMDVDGGAGGERIAESEGEEDPAAMQIEMEMRGPPRTNGEESASANASATPSASARMSSGGFTAINGR
ncbi:DNA-directed DNA polymerase [Ascochyta rabiei]|uniref:Sequence-specific DNA binding n=1 Tax=Didymella rabiei TaxID=5454 RepID=A0A163KNU7_DIDRA|nr:DNA-directed DNA polymerase [Ascochyta rabiei]KZM27136.1 sequence-specific DNA binding [Ascochyta rabiei]UPX18702.1 DNA-directed DNA polymerase [Ascochyta rabiei]